LIRTSPSERTWRRVIAGGNHAAFGFIAAEADLSRDLE
jgi:hypothetical protein